MKTRKVYRRPVQVVVTVLGFLVFDAMTTSFVVMMIKRGFRVALGFVSVPWAFCVFVTLRALLVGVVAKPRGLVVRNWFRTYRIGWAEVERVLPATENWPGSVGIVLREGRTIRCGGLAAARYEEPSRLDPIVAELTARLRAASGLATTE